MLKRRFDIMVWKQRRVRTALWAATSHDMTFDRVLPRLTEDEVLERRMVPEDTTIIYVLENRMEGPDNETGYIFFRARDKSCCCGWGYTFYCAKEGVADTQASLE